MEHNWCGLILGVKSCFSWMMAYKLVDYIVSDGKVTTGFSIVDDVFFAFFVDDR